MSSSRLLLRERSRTFSKLLCNLSFNRQMGGGPRTFPGGLNKWQWKRLHEKKAKEKETKLLQHEKQLYEARIRSEIRAKLAGTSGRPFASDAPQSSTHNPMTAKDHIKVLADRFMKEGAEDLWNEDDGPLKSPPVHPRRLRTENPPLDLRKIASDARNSDSFDRQHLPSSESDESDFESVAAEYPTEHRQLDFRKTLSDRRNSKAVDCEQLHHLPYVSDESDSEWIATANGCTGKDDNSIGPHLDSRMIGSGRSFTSFARRCFSVEARRRSGLRSLSGVKCSLANDNDTDREFGSEVRAKSRRRRFNYEDSDEDSDSDSGGRVFRTNMMSSTALRNYDMKIKRQPPKIVEEENGSSDEIQTIRDELRRRHLDGNSEKQCEKEESLLSQKRYADEDIVLI